MRPWLLAVACFLGALLLGGISSYPVFSLIQSIASDGLLGFLTKYPFSRVSNRCFMLAGILFLIIYLRLCRFEWRDVWTTKKEIQQSLPAFAKAYTFGLLSLGVIAILFISLDIRVIRPQLELSKILKKIASGLIAGLAVGLIEELVFRKLILDHLSKRMVFFKAAFFSSSLYAMVHFVKAKSAITDLGYFSGFTHFFNAFSMYKDPAIVGSLLTLLVVGMFLCYTARSTKTLVHCIGIHAAWVMLIRTFKGLTYENPRSNLSFLIGSYDGITGYLAALWLLILLILAYVFVFPQGDKNAQEITSNNIP